MAAVLLKLIFWFIITLSNIVSRLIFTGVAYFLVLITQAFRVPGQAIQGALEQIAEAIRACFEYILGLVIEAMSSLISSFFDQLVEAVKGSAAVAGSTIAGLAEMTRNSIDGLFKDLPELAEEISEMVSNLVKDLWNNYREAVGYVTENA